MYAFLRRLQAIAILVVVAVLGGLSKASTWVDPDWPTMLGKSSLIVLVEVVHG